MNKNEQCEKIFFRIVHFCSFLLILNPA